MSDVATVKRPAKRAVPRRHKSVRKGTIPLCVDLDGTLLRTDLLHETALALLRRNLLYLFLMPFWLLKGKAHLKAEIARRVTLDPAALPYSDDFLAYLRKQKANGRTLVLATASHDSLAKRVAAHLGLFDMVIATNGAANLKGAAKLAKLRESFPAGFDYAGNGHCDLVLLCAAREALLVNPERGVRAAAFGRGANVTGEFGAASGLRGYIKALRLHQWLKNLLIFLPLLLAHRVFDIAAWQEGVIAFLAFGLCASSVYVLNDLLDLADDRRHAEKRLRPFAAGTVPVTHGLVMAPLLLAGAAGLAAMLPWQFGAVLAFYYALTLAYSFFLKRTMLFDVITLAGLYTIRIVAGSAALDVERSPWLLAVSVFVFFSLALVKRYVELGEATDTHVPLSSRSRGYRAADRETLSQVGIASGLMSVLVLALYIDSDNVRELYPHPEVIWFLCPLMLYLIVRIWMLARRGEMPGDPVLFAARDWRSQAMVGLGALMLMVAAL